MAMLPRVETIPPTVTRPARQTIQPRALKGDIGIANSSAGLIAIVSYMFGAVPVMLGVLGTLNLSPAHLSSWIFITFFTSGAGSILLSLRYRQPVAIGWSLPALVLIGTMGGRYSMPELIGASLIAGVVVLALGALGIGERIMHWVPLPLVLAMFAGSMLHYVTGVFAQFGAQPLIVGGALTGYVLARHCACSWMPPVAGAVIAGVTAAAVAGQVHVASVAWAMPSLALSAPSFSASSILALSLPLVVLTIGTGNVQGIGLLLNQGYRVPINPITSAIGLSSIANAAFGGHTATIQSASGAILVSEEAGPRETRYVASVIAGVGCLIIAGMAAMVGSMLGVLPSSLVLSLAGIAILRTLMDATEKTMTTDLRLGAFFAFMIAASPLTILGVGAAPWAIAGGYIVSLVVERPALLAELRRTGCTDEGR